MPSGMLRMGAGEGCGLDAGRGRAARSGETVGVSTMALVLSRDCRISSGIAAASGRLRQYFFGISDVIADTISRAGLKIDEKYARQYASSASSSGTSAGVAPAPSRSVSPSQCALRYGVRMLQVMVANRRTKNGAFASTM